MNIIQDILPGSLVYPVGWVLLHFLWQGVVVGAVLSLGLPILRRRSASIRYGVACVALGIILILPAATLWYIWTPAPAAVSVVTKVLTAEVLVVSDSLAGIDDGVAGVGPRPAPPVGPWLERVRDMMEGYLPFLVAAWSGGVVILSIRLLSGWILAGRLRREENRPAGGAGRAACGSTWSG